MGARYRSIPVGWRDCSEAGRSCQRRPGDPCDRCMARMSHMQARPAILSRSHANTTAQHTPSVKPLAAPPCMADSSWSTRDRAHFISSWLKGHVGGVAPLGSEDPTAMEDTKAGPASTAQRLDLSVPLRTRGTSAPHLVGRGSLGGLALRLGPTVQRSSGRREVRSSEVIRACHRDRGCGTCQRTRASLTSTPAGWRGRRVPRKSGLTVIWISGRSMTWCVE
jgi:hypothetical protein